MGAWKREKLPSLSPTLPFSDASILLLKADKITKRFPGVLANDQISLEVEAGEIHALLGQNGAGKTTLMNILYGLYPPDSGEIYFKGQKVLLDSPRKAIELGIGMVHQHFMLISTFTVAENLLIGLKASEGPLLNLKKAEQQIAELSRRYGLQVDPKAKIWQLSVGSRQRVEIIKALYRGAELLILDEPTSVLTPPEAKELFKVLRALAAQGKSIIFITHKLNEVMEICDRATILRDGKKVGVVKITPEGPGKEESKGESFAQVGASPSDKLRAGAGLAGRSGFYDLLGDLARMMMGRELPKSPEKKSVQPGDVVLKVHELEAVDDRHLPVLKKISFSVRAGEILGIAGVAGNGQSELVEVLTGLRRATGGQVLVNGQEIQNRSPREILDRGVAHIPEDRQERGLVLDLPLPENAVLGFFHKAPFSSHGWLNYSEIHQFTERLIVSYDVKAPHKRVILRALSGGNQQKFLVGRELSRFPRLLLAVQPTLGLDIGATAYIHQKLLEQRENRTAILLVSTELDEILALSDRIAVLYEGQITGILPADQADGETLGLMMGGA